MIHRHLQTLLQKEQRVVRFALVGGSGVIVNMALFEGAIALGEGQFRGDILVNLAAIVGFTFSCFSNFLFNNFWTWGDRRDAAQMPFFRRMLAYYTVAGSALLVQLFALNLFRAEIGPFWANLVGIGAGTIVNFVINHFWTFRNKETL